jgi:hypothetical protein
MNVQRACGGGFMSISAVNAENPKPKPNKYLLRFSLISFKLTKGSNKAEQTFEM